MICGTFTMTDVPNSMKDAIVNGFRTNVPPPIDVTATKQADGRWTIVAQWPPCPAATSHSPDNGSIDVRWETPSDDWL